MQKFKLFRKIVWVDLVKKLNVVLVYISRKNSQGLEYDKKFSLNQYKSLMKSYYPLFLLFVLFIFVQFIICLSLFFLIITLHLLYFFLSFSIYDFNFFFINYIFLNANITNNSLLYLKLFVQLNDIRV